MPVSAEFWKLAEERLEDAVGLLAMQRWSCAYYIAGYAVACALKAIIAREAERSGELFNDAKDARQLIDKFYVHDLNALMTTAKLSTEFGVALQNDPALVLNWDATKAWKESSRYALTGEVKARGLVEAIANQPHGVMTWLRTKW